MTFGKWSKNSTETTLVYLGRVTKEKGKTYKIMTSVWIWGLSHRATSRILIFDKSNKYIGDYYLTTLNDIPDKMVNGVLYFDNKDNPNCDNRVVTKVDLNKGIPKQIFVECENGFGDIWSFNNNE